MNSINQESTNVQQDQTAQDIDQNNNIEASADSITNESGLITTGFDEMKYLSFEELKERISFRELLEADGHRFKGTGGNAKCCCPFHPDRTPSFSVHPNDGVAHCFGCHWKGDIYQYVMESRSVDFIEAWVKLNEWFLGGSRTIRKPVTALPAAKSATIQLTEEQHDEREQYGKRLETDLWLAERICQQRFEWNGERWNPQTLRHMAMDGPLGWSGDCLVFMYPTGNKFRRWPGKEFIWEGEKLSLWRRHGISSATHVYLTEGETDAITLIDRGVEDDPNTTVVAVPGAGSFQAEWAKQFEGKTVTLFFDNDEAGEAGAEKTGTLLQPYASEILTVNLGGAK